MDWDKYTKDEKLEDELEKNRKDGYLAKKAFLNQAQAMDYAHQKKIEKHENQLKNEKIKQMWIIY